MRNDYIGTSIDGDARASCPCRISGSTGHSRPSCNSCQGRSNNGGNRQPCNSHCSNPADYSCDNECHQPHNTCDNNCRQPRNTCNNDCDGRQRPCDDPCFCHDRTPAMVYAQQHDLDSIYCAEKALLRGTLFGCLDKPMCNERCTDNPCISQCQMDKFAIWELRLYLNTHPCDQKALALLRKLTEQMDNDCGCTFYPDCNRWSWQDDPWPWEYQRCCGKEA